MTTNLVQPGAARVEPEVLQTSQCRGAPRELFRRVVAHESPAIRRVLLMPARAPRDFSRLQAMVMEMRSVLRLLSQALLLSER